MDRSSSSLNISERICAVFIPLIGIIQAVVLSFTACFDHHLPPKKLRYTIDDLRRIASNSLFTVNEVEALLELFKKLSGSIIDDGLIHKEDLKLALLKTPASDNLILDRVRQMLNAILLESGLQISEESLEVIIDKVKKAGFKAKTCSFCASFSSTSFLFPFKAFDIHSVGFHVYSRHLQMLMLTRMVKLTK
ncbi:hypothetical protein NC651_008013 [Populus alba x Populus x berolinensis]|nr:hypothetical protein NC651_008013 [Populus alba x Populus x berolinensis]